MSAHRGMVPSMNARARSLRTDLRYLLVLHIHRHGLTTVSEMVTMLADIGFDVDGRPSKTISDALRTDVKLDRVRRRDRGLYSPGALPRSTQHRMRTRADCWQSTRQTEQPLPCHAEQDLRGAPGNRQASVPHEQPHLV